jgi:hypothetical protein
MTTPSAACARLRLLDVRDTTTRRPAGERTMKTYHFEEQIEIAAPRHLVWSVAQDEVLRRRWDTRMMEHRRLTAGPLGPGALVDVSARLLWRRFNVRLQYLTWLPPFRSGVRSLISKQGDERMSVEWRFDEIDPGITRWTYTATIRRPGGPFAALHLLVYGGLFRARTRRSMERLRDIVQTAYRSRPAVRGSECQIPVPAPEPAVAGY